MASSGTQNVAIDLANVVGTLDVENITAYINSELETAGALTRLQVERFHEAAYGFRLQMSSAETVTFIPTGGTETAVLEPESGPLAIGPVPEDTQAQRRCSAL